jgi:hypothetical protein
VTTAGDVTDRFPIVGLFTDIMLGKRDPPDHSFAQTGFKAPGRSAFEMARPPDLGLLRISLKWSLRTGMTCSEVGRALRVPGGAGKPSAFGVVDMVGVFSSSPCRWGEAGALAVAFGLPKKAAIPSNLIDGVGIGGVSKREMAGKVMFRPAGLGVRRGETWLCLGVPTEISEARKPNSSTPSAKEPLLVGSSGASSMLSGTFWVAPNVGVARASSVE